MTTGKQPGELHHQPGELHHQPGELHHQQILAKY
jgi:hypothetical protein